MKNKKFYLILFIVIILAIIICIFILKQSRAKIDCNSYSVDGCPKSCVVCPPCEACSSLKCGSTEFCNSIGFNKSWYEEIRRRLGK